VRVKVNQEGVRLDFFRARHFIRHSPSPAATASSRRHQLQRCRRLHPRPENLLPNDKIASRNSGSQLFLLNRGNLGPIYGIVNAYISKASVTKIAPPPGCPTIRLLPESLRNGAAAAQVGTARKTAVSHAFRQVEAEEFRSGDGVQSPMGR
jgi:hypothetical protein